VKQERFLIFSPGSAEVAQRGEAATSKLATKAKETTTTPFSPRPWGEGSRGWRRLRLWAVRARSVVVLTPDPPGV